MPIDKIQLDKIWFSEQRGPKLNREREQLLDSLKLLQQTQLQHQRSITSKTAKEQNEAAIIEKIQAIQVKEKEIYNNQEKMLRAMEKLAADNSTNQDFQSNGITKGFDGSPGSLDIARSATDAGLEKQKQVMDAIPDKSSPEYQTLEKNYNRSVEVRKNFGDYLNNILTGIETIQQSEQRVLERNKKYAPEPDPVILNQTTTSNTMQPVSVTQNPPSLLQRFVNILPNWLPGISFLKLFAELMGSNSKTENTAERIIKNLNEISAALNIDSLKNSQKSLTSQVQNISNSNVKSDITPRHNTSKTTVLADKLASLAKTPTVMTSAPEAATPEQPNADNNNTRKKSTSLR